MKKIFSTTIGGRSLRVEIGEVAKQAQASALVYYGDTCVLSTVCSKANENPLQDFFPLMVIYQEKKYAGGKIPGNFMRREGKGSEYETLMSRLIDRPIRPLFKEGYKDEVQVVNTVMSFDAACSAPLTAMLGSSIALSISALPFEGPIAGVCVGMIDGQFVINPSISDLGKSTLNLTVAGTKDAINMVEAGASELSEETMVEAILFAHAEIKKICAFIASIQAEIGEPKKAVEITVYNPKLVKELEKNYAKKIKTALLVFDKQERDNALNALRDEVIELYSKEYDKLNLTEELRKLYDNEVFLAYEDLVKIEFRKLITVDKIRPDSRKVKEIRPLSSRLDILPKAHGSALFTRGQTQALAVLTLGGEKDKQIIDDLGFEEEKRFTLHYNFPPYSVGETGRYGAPGRREIGHGTLARRAILPMLPTEEEFPYTIRVVSEILESNGSSSMATVCGSTLALMAGGVPLKSPVAGIAMGLIKEGKNYTILTDIQGMEDHLGDMDFKVAGTKAGITALQMDIKIDGIDKAILTEALADAKEARFALLAHMQTTISEPRQEVADCAPHVKVININPDKIKDVIGSGGKVINQIIQDCGNCDIEISQDGKVVIRHPEAKYIQMAYDKVYNLTREVEVGTVYEAKVIRIEKYGAFVELWPGMEGLMHISQIALERIEKVEDVLSLGDQVLVKCIGVDEKGRVDLSRKEVLKKNKTK